MPSSFSHTLCEIHTCLPGKGTPALVFFPFPEWLRAPGHTLQNTTQNRGHPPCGAMRSLRFPAHPATPAPQTE
ncbi:hypothetical protein DV515_00006742 [Chloebia gouldiae]|uniref:Uncharacterized protein n=1 Tax=Chloebia gouldiae TaxID=44316 RepID=A0A3L8SIQ3_CHLGU|nr:hypothetical protein DV515_00006742 [Chloebia gouldiae]